MKARHEHARTFKTCVVYIKSPTITEIKRKINAPARTAQRSNIIASAYRRASHVSCAEKVAERKNDRYKLSIKNRFAEQFLQQLVCLLDNGIAGIHNDEKPDRFLQTLLRRVHDKVTRSFGSIFIILLAGRPDI